MNVQIGHLNVNVLRNNLHAIQQFQHFLLNLGSCIVSPDRCIFPYPCSHSRCPFSDPRICPISGLLSIFCDHLIYFGESLSCLFVDFQSGFFLYLFLLLQGVPIGCNKIFLRLFDLLELPFDDGVGDIIITSFSEHTFHIEWVYHVLSLFRLVLFFCWLLLYLLFGRLGHFL